MQMLNFWETHQKSDFFFFEENEHFVPSSKYTPRRLKYIHEEKKKKNMKEYVIKVWWKCNISLRKHCRHHANWRKWREVIFFKARNHFLILNQQQNEEGDFK